MPAVIAVLLIIGTILSFVTPLGALIRKDIWLMYYTGDIVRNPARQREKIADDLIFITTCMPENSIGERRGHLTIVPLFLYRVGLRWEAAQFRDNARWFFFPFVDPANANYTLGETIVQRLGDYTFLIIGDRSGLVTDLTEETLYDNLGTKPVLVSKEKLGLEADQGQWASIPGTRPGYWSGTVTLQPNCYLFAIKNMPDDYEMYYEDMVITKAQIDELLPD